MKWKSFVLAGAFVGVFALGAMFAPIQQPAATTDEGKDLALVQMAAEEEPEQQSEFVCPKNGGGMGKGPGGMMGSGKGMGMMGMGSTMHDVIAEELGMTAEELYTARSEGKSIADLAEEKGIKVEELQSKLIEAKKAMLEQYVKEGKMTQEQLDVYLEYMVPMMEAMIERDGTGPMHGQGGMGMGPGGCGQNADTSNTTNTINKF